MGARISAANADSPRTLSAPPLPRTQSAQSVPSERPQAMVRAASFPQSRKTLIFVPAPQSPRPAAAPFWQPSRYNTLLPLMLLSIACCCLGQSVEAAQAHRGHGVANLVSLLAGLCVFICIPFCRSSADRDDAD